MEITTTKKEIKKLLLEHNNNNHIIENIFQSLDIIKKRCEEHRESTEYLLEVKKVIDYLTRRMGY